MGMNILKQLKIKKCKDCKYYKELGLPTCKGTILKIQICQRNIYVEPLKLFCSKKESD